MEIDILRRLNAAITVLKMLGIINTQGDIAKALGYKREGTISEIVKGKVPISDKFLISFCSTYEISEAYLKIPNQPLFIRGSKNEKIFFESPDLSNIKRELFIAETQIKESSRHTKPIEPYDIRKLGKTTGTPYSGEKGTIIADIFNTPEYKELYDVKLKLNNPWKGVPIFDAAVSADILSLKGDDMTIEPSYYLPIPSFKGCRLGARVTGDSMYPEIRSGDFVILKDVTYLIYGEIYLFVTKDGQETVKRVHPNDNPDFINLVPSNPTIPITPISKSNIIKAYKVKGVIKSY